MIPLLVATAHAVTSAPIVTTKDAPFHELSLPVGVLLAAEHPDLRDLRVLDATGVEVPYALVPASADKVRSVAFFPLREPDLAAPRVVRDPDGRVTGVSSAGRGAVRGYLLDGGSDAARLVAVDLALPADAGYQRVDVDVSDDLARWTPAVADAGLVRLKVDGHEVRRERVPVPKASGRYVRVVWPKGAPDLEGAHLTTRADPEDTGPVWTPPAVATRTAEGDTLVLPHPVRAQLLRVTFPSANVLAPVELWTTASPDRAWTRHTDTLVYRLEAQGRDWTSDDLALPPVVSGVRLTPRSASLGEPPPTFSLGVRPDRVLFVASGKGPYTLTVGRPDAEAVALAPEVLVPGYGTADAPPIGEARVDLDVPVLPASSPPAPPPRPWTLWAVLGAGVVALGAMAASLATRVRG